MSDNRRLKDKLLKLASEDSSVDDGWRRILASDDNQALAAILVEIDETLTTREISVRNDRGDILQFEAGNRRLRRFISPAPAELSSFEKLFENQISDPTDNLIDEIGEMLLTFLKDSKSAWVRPTIQSSDGDAGKTGVSARALAETWSLELESHAEVDLDSAFEAFIEATLALCPAWIRNDDGQVIATAGEDSHAGWLKDSASVDWRAYIQEPGGQTSNDDAPTLCLAGSDVAPDTHLLIATFGKSVVVSLLGSEKRDEVTTNWRTLGL